MDQELFEFPVLIEEKNEVINLFLTKEDMAKATKGKIILCVYVDIIIIHFINCSRSDVRLTIVLFFIDEAFLTQLIANETRQEINDVSKVLEDTDEENAVDSNNAGKYEQFIFV